MTEKELIALLNYYLDEWKYHYCISFSRTCVSIMVEKPQFFNFKMKKKIKALTLIIQDRKQASVYVYYGYYFKKQ